MEALLDFTNCHLCPRNCGINRTISVGFCGCGSTLKAARAALHHWEEPCISGTRGSGAVFFSGCTLKCCFCQNHLISQGTLGKELSPKRLGEIFLSLQEQGAHNIDLITATQFLPQILPALDFVKHKLHIPVIYNCGGYEKTETLALLKDYIDIYLPDLKYFDSSLSWRYSKAKNYFEIASEAIPYMIEQTGELRYDAQGILQKGVIIRHMVLPGGKEDSIQLLHWIKENLPKGKYLLSLLSQYTPFYKSRDYPEINRRITTYEYTKVLDTAISLGLTQGFMQEKSSAKEEYTPPFDLEGI
ncbi:radical SAM protein [Blautia sp.]|uniref:radical SAM protein n=1 Tax=Blautia sp. TaxID=1955243 RepID=UPI002E7A1A63|nr:radical SAM protein [Blautia sp.]MEE0809456.1 radical SAM protein [Blautia sp.]